MISFQNSARSMVGGGYNGSNGWSANKFGTRNIQVCVAGFGYKDFTKTRLRNAWVLAEIMDAHSIPWHARKTWGSGASRKGELWNHGGIQGHQHGPNDDHTDPGEIDAKKLMRVMRVQQKHRRARLSAASRKSA
jgi:hypothetical protein